MNHTEKSANGFSVGNITVSQDQQQDQVQIKFAKRPPAAVTGHLKDAGWRWNKAAMCWWSRRNSRTLAFAYAMVGEKAPVVTEDDGLKAYTDVDSQQEDAWARQVGR